MRSWLQVAVALASIGFAGCKNDELKSPRLGASCGAPANLTIDHYSTNCHNPVVSFTLPAGAQTVPVTGFGVFNLPTDIPDGTYPLTLLCDGGGHISLGDYTLPCATDLGVPSDLSVPPGTLDMAGNADLSTAPDLAPSQIRAAFYLDVDETPSPSPNPTPAPQGIGFQAIFFDDTQTPTAEAAIKQDATQDPGGLSVIPDGTCLLMSPPPTVTGLPPLVHGPDSLSLRVGGGGAQLLAASPAPIGDPFYGAFSNTVFSTTLINPGIDVFVIDTLSPGGTLVGNVPTPDIPSEFKQPVTIDHTAPFTTTWGIAPRSGFNVSSTRVYMSVGGYRCAAPFTAGTLTVPVFVTGTLTPGKHTFTFTLADSLSFSLHSTHYTPSGGGAVMTYGPTTGAFTFRFLSYSLGGVVN